MLSVLATLRANIRFTLQLQDAMQKQLRSGAKELDILQWTNRGALEVMGQAGLGYSFDSFVENPSNDFARALKELLCVLSCLPKRVRTR